MLGSAAQTLQSFDTTAHGSEINEDANTALDMTEDELAMFNDTKPLVTTGAEDESIVVRYSNPESTEPLMIDESAAPGYATINEIVNMEKKKDKKMERKILQKSSSNKGISGPEKHSNSLLKLGGSIPPTPPPTPATVASIAPSDERKEECL